MDYVDASLWRGLIATNGPRADHFLHDRCQSSTHRYHGRHARGSGSHDTSRAQPQRIRTPQVESMTRPTTRQHAAQTVTHEADIAMHTSHAQASPSDCLCCSSRAIAPGPALLLTVSSPLARRRRLRLAATAAEHQQLESRCPDSCVQLAVSAHHHVRMVVMASPAPPSRWCPRRPSACGRYSRHPAASRHPPHPPDSEARSCPLRGELGTARGETINDYNTVSKSPR